MLYFQKITYFCTRCCKINYSLSKKYDINADY